MINYTIIIPHKNSADLLQYCLNTIPVRDDIQVIVVDDNSDPIKVDFNNFPQWKGKNYEYYFTKEGKGAGYARNVGIDKAKGKWLVFVDADDFLLPCADRVFSENIDNTADIIYFRVTAVMLSDRKTESNRARDFNRILDDCIEHGKKDRLAVTFCPWGKFIKSSLIKEYNIRFEEIKYSNDNYFTSVSFCNAKETVIKNDCYYVITEGNKGSLTHNYMEKPGELKCRAEAFLRSYKYSYEQGRDSEAARNNAWYLIPKIYANDFGLYKKYFFFLNSIGFSKMELLRKQFSDFNRIERWRSYLSTLFRLYL